MFRCVEALGPDASECMCDREAVMAQSNPAEVLAGDRVHIVDLSDLSCPDGTCLLVIGNVVVYLDTNHLSGSYRARWPRRWSRRSGLSAPERVARDSPVRSGELDSIP